jgi:hypothetical protein
MEKSSNIRTPAILGDYNGKKAAIYLKSLEFH